MFEVIALDLFLNDQKIGIITHLPGDKNVFTFDPVYINDQNRPTLSLSFKDAFDNIISNIKSTRTRLPPFFLIYCPKEHCANI